MKIRVTAKNYRREVLEAGIPVLVEFFAEWCGKCAMMEDVVDAITKQCEGMLKVCQIEIDESAGLAEEFQVESVPAFILFKEGTPVSAADGVLHKEVVLDMIWQETGIRITV